MANKELKKGTIMYLSINDFFQKYLTEKQGQLDNFQIIVISKDIIADTETRVNNMTMYESRFDDIEFLTQLYPHTDTLNYLLGNTRESFRERYIEQLDSLDEARLICCIVDMVINDGVDVYMISSKTEMMIGFYDVVREYMNTKFSMDIKSFEEYCENPECLNDIGDENEIRMMLQFQIEQLKLIDADIGEFFNVLTKDMATTYRDILMKKSIDELYRIGTNNNLHINKHKPKEYIVDHIMSKLMSKHTELPFD